MFDIYFQNTGSQESIIELDLDDDDGSEGSPSDQRRRYSVSPMPQIRSSESQVKKPCTTSLEILIKKKSFL